MNMRKKVQITFLFCYFNITMTLGWRNLIRLDKKRFVFRIPILGMYRLSLTLSYNFSINIGSMYIEMRVEYQ